MSEPALRDGASEAAGRPPGRVRPGWLVAVAGVLLFVAGVHHLAATAAGPRYEGLSLAEWLRLAVAGDARQRYQAERMLGRAGPEAVPYLIRALYAREPWYWAKWQRLRSLLLRRAPVPSRIPMLRVVAANALTALGPVASNAVPALLEVEGRDWISMTEVRRALRAFGPAAEAHLLRVLRSEDPRQIALVSDAVADPVFLPIAERLAPALWAVLEDPRRSPPREAVEAVLVLSPSDPGLAARLLGVAPRANWETVRLILQTVGAAGVAARDLADQVVPYLAHPVPVVRAAAAQTLHALRPPAPEAVQVLISLLETPGARWEAAKALGEIGPDAEAAIPTLLAQIETAPTHRPSRTPSFAALALGQLGPAAVPGLVTLLDHPRAETRIQAAVALAGHGAAAAPAVPGLIRMLKADDPEEQMPAALTLGALGQVAAEALPDLTRLAELETTQDVAVGHVRSAARTALANILAEPARPEPRAVVRSADALNHENRASPRP